MTTDARTRPPSPSTPRELILLANATDVLGGVTAWTHQMARLFGAHGHRVQVVGIHEAELKLTLPEPPAYPVTALYPAHPPTPWRPRTPRDFLDLAARRRERARVADKRRAVARLSDIFRAAGPGALVIVTQVWPMEWVLEADTTGLRLIGMSHESYEYSRRCHRHRWIKNSYPRVDRWLTLTQEDADAWIAEGFDNVGALPNALGSLPELPSPRTAKTVASIGRLDDQKGIDLLLETWSLVAGERPEWRLRIYGAGQDGPALKKQCTSLGLDGSVEWMGRTDDVPGALADSSVFVQSSRGEGFPLALMEAMASGVPCAAFDCAPGVREIVRDGEDGLLAPPGDTDALADRLLRLTGNPRLRDTLGDRARVNVQRWSQTEILRRWHDLFALLDL
ncbi:glycosyltransferase [Streptomyces sp. NBC_01498]|uniref:glycosyltransferase n=1 Tax=Streptomyces sp. NBC_01498 TaxID=2975870 RepID=UPI002E7BA1C6|nr:glycosyltransferase [Streptomyces sp. NBC_01498]WTL26624.1 glycosyltransferase [Streptomyces sp. NBC_01498]